MSSGHTLKVVQGRPGFDSAHLDATMASMARRVLIVDDHAGFRSFARQLLTAEGYEVLGEAERGSAVVGAVRRLKPDLVLLDVRLPDIDGFEVAERLADEPDPPMVVLISSRDAADYGTRLPALHARGFLAKADLSRAAIDALCQ